MNTRCHARLLLCSFVVATFALGLTADTVHAADYYVSTSGSDSNPGTASAPWRSVAYAVSSSSPVGAGDVINVRGGTYAEYVQIGKSGSDGSPIVLRSYPGETATLTSGGTLGNIYATQRCNWTIQRLEIRDSNGGAGIYWDGSRCTGSVTIENNRIHNTDSGDNSSCILMQRNVGTYIIKDNTLYDCDGTSLSGNTTGLVIFGHINPGNPGLVTYLVHNNEVYNEGVAIKIKHPFAIDQTVIVDVSYNLIHNIYSKSAIMTSGGKFIANKTNRIHHNVVFNSPGAPAIDVGDDFDEYGVEVDHNTVYNVGNGFSVCLADNCSNGGSRNISLHDNIFVPVARNDANGFAIWTEVTSTPFTGSDYNCFWSLGSSQDVVNWGGYGGTALSFAQWQARGFDLRSVRADPRFVNPAAGNFRLQSGSPCKNLRGNGRDAGAYETNSEVIGPGGTGPGAPTPPTAPPGAPSNLRLLPGE